jgi:hypothetical protein
MLRLRWISLRQYSTKGTDRVPEIHFHRTTTLTPSSTSPDSPILALVARRSSEIAPTSISRCIGSAFERPTLPKDRAAFGNACTSNRTFSGGESFAYNLQMLGRARTVGETTGGGANPSWPLAIDSKFRIMVPFASAINPVSHTNFEGVGVKPDIAVPEAAALDTAHRVALEELVAASKDADYRRSMGQEIDRLTKEIESHK